MKETFPRNQNLVGTWYAVTAFGLWGFLPIYWKLLQQVSPYEIVAHRVLWTLMLTLSLLFVQRRIADIKEVFKNKKNLKRVIFCALLLGVNWVTFVYAINSDKVLDASMGYYINPLVSVFLGLIILKEKVNFPQKISIVLAFTGVLILTVRYGKVPWIALTLAGTFGLYGLLKKGLAAPAPGEPGKEKESGGVDALTGLTLETLFLLPVALIYIILTTLNGTGVPVTGSSSMMLLLMSTGLATGVPLLFFAGAAQRIPLSRVGFIQYLTPTCFFLLGRFVYHEAFSTTQLISFIFIWAALALYSLASFRLRPTF